VLAISAYSCLRRKPISSKRASKAALADSVKGAVDVLGDLAIKGATSALLSSS